MIKKNLTGLLLLLSSLMFSQAQLRVTLKDGNIVLGTATLSKVSLVTDYGKLEIPVKNVSAIKMAEKADDGENVKTVDIVEIDYTYNMAGQTNIKTLEIKTEYGTLNIPGEKMERIEVFTAADGQTSFKLVASKHISSNTSGGWLNTGVMLKKGQSFTITANGQVVLASLSGAKYTPDGKTAGATTTGSTYDYGEEDSGSTYPTYGNVVYKIGDQGTMLKAGAKFTGEATDNGILYLSIYEVVFNPQNAGSYLVKVDRK